MSSLKQILNKLSTPSKGVSKLTVGFRFLTYHSVAIVIWYNQYSEGKDFNFFLYFYIFSCLIIPFISHIVSKFYEYNLRIAAILFLIDTFYLGSGIVIFNFSIIAVTFFATIALSNFTLFYGIKKVWQPIIVLIFSILVCNSINEDYIHVYNIEIINWSLCIIMALYFIYSSNLVFEILKKYKEARKKVDEKNEEIIESIAAAKRIQNAFFLDEVRDIERLPPHFALFRPKDIVSGDFYWTYSCKHCEDDCFFVSVADCTGHGVPGAFMSILGYSFIRNILTPNDKISPAELLEELRNKLIKELNQTSDKTVYEGMDISIAKVNRTKNEIQFAGAKSTMYLINSKNGLTEIKGDKQSIEFSKKMKPFENKVVKFEEGDIIYLFSDGFPDQFGGSSKKKFGNNNFKEVLEKASKKDIVEQKNYLETILEYYKSIEEQTDDVTVIGIQI